MGNSSSHTHEPLERGFTRGKFGDVKNGKSASFRFSKKSSKNMDLFRSISGSFRRKKDPVPESSKPHKWQDDERAVRSDTCSFPVKYLGCVEVFESRGMKICEEALILLRSSRRRPVRGVLHVSGDGLRVVDDETRSLIVDQTIEKVSFCAPDSKRYFSYICRDGTSRRWMCHGFQAAKDSGERLSHAVGCAFAVCLEKKQRRDKECGVTATFDTKNSTFTRIGSFRQQTLTERLASDERSVDGVGAVPLSAVVQPQPKPYNPYAIERPHATPLMLERQCSFRALGTIGSQSPFKRQMSLRINDLPSNAERQRAFLAAAQNGGYNALSIATPNRGVSPIPEVSPAKLSTGGEVESGGVSGINGGVDTFSQVCQEFTQGMSLLTQTDTLLADADDLNFINNLRINQNIIAAEKQQQQHQQHMNTNSNSPTVVGSGAYRYIGGSSSSMVSGTTPNAQVTPRLAGSPMGGSGDTPTTPTIVHTSTSIATPTLPLSSSTALPLPVEVVTPLPNADQWLGQVVKATSPAAVKRVQPPLSAAGRTQSLNIGAGGGTVIGDPFDAEWAAGVTAKQQLQQPELANTTTTIVTTPVATHSTNPFISPPKAPAQTFQEQL